MRLGAYTLIKKIAEGGVADIYLAKARTAAKADKYLICKCLKKSLSEDTDFLKSILTEIQCTMKIRHPNVLEIFDLCACEGQSFLTMEYLDAQDFHKLLKKNADTGEAMPIPMAIYAIGQAALGLHAAHELTDSKGNPVHLVHRDVSPENILFGWNGDVKMADFGIAKISMMVDETPPDMIKGKFHYMSPEHAWGDKLDRRSDVFSLAVVMYEAVLNRSFYGGDSVADVLNCARMAVFDAPHDVQADFPPALEEILLKALDLDKKQRYPTALEFKMALDAFAKAQDMEVSRQDWVAYLKTRLTCPETRLPLMKAGEMAVDAQSILKPEMMALDVGGLDSDITGQLSKECIDEIVGQAANMRTGVCPVSQLKKLASMPSMTPIKREFPSRAHISPLDEVLDPVPMHTLFEKTTEASVEELSKAMSEEGEPLEVESGEKKEDVSEEMSEVVAESSADDSKLPLEQGDSNGELEENAVLASSSEQPHEALEQADIDAASASALQTPESHMRRTVLFVTLGVTIIILVILLIWMILV